MQNGIAKVSDNGDMLGKLFKDALMKPIWIWSSKAFFEDEEGGDERTLLITKT